MLVSFSEVLMAAGRWVMELKGIINDAEARNQKYLLAFKLRKSNQALPWRKNNRKPTPADGLQRCSELKWTRGFPWMYMHGPKHCFRVENEL